MKRFILRAAALLLAWALCPGFFPGAMALPPPPGYLDSGEAPGGGTQWEKPDPMEIAGSRPDYHGTLVPLPLGTRPELPETVLCLTSVRGGTLDCPVEWDTSGLEEAGPGRFYLPGRLVPPEGYHFAEAPPNALAPDSLEPYPLFFYADGMEPEELLSIRVPFFSGEQAEPVYRLGVGKDPRSLPFWNAGAVCSTTQGETFSLPVRWDAEALRADRPGRYTLPGAVQLPPGFSPPKGFAPISVEVEVGDPLPVLLTKPRLEGDGVVCDLTGSVEDLQWLRAERKDDLPDAVWRNCIAQLEDDGRMHGVFVVYDSAALTVQTGRLTEGVRYSFRLRCQGVYTNVLHVRVPAGGGPPEFSLEGEADKDPPPDDPFDDPTSGDHGGGDREDQELPPLRQPAPGQNPPAPDEQSTQTGVVLSGVRLKELAGLNQTTVLFEKQGVAAELPVEFLRGLDLGDRSLLAVTIGPAGTNGFRLEILLDERLLEALPPTLIRLPLAEPPAAGAALACYDEKGAYVCDAGWDPALGLASVEITRTGTYAIREKEPEPPASRAAAGPAPEPPAPPAPPEPRFPPLVLAALPGGCMGLWLILRRKGVWRRRG